MSANQVSVSTAAARRLGKGATIAALGLAVAMGATACSAGKISQTNNMEAAINGANGTLVLDPEAGLDEQVNNAGTVAIRNLQIIYPSNKAEEIFGDGGPFKLGFTITNDSLVRTVKLRSIATVPNAQGQSTGKVEFLSTDASGNTVRSASPAGDTGTIAPNGAITAGVPSGVQPENYENDGVQRMTVELTGTGTTVAAGLTKPLELTFDVFDLARGDQPAKQVGTQTIVINAPVDGSPLDGVQG